MSSVTRPTLSCGVVGAISSILLRTSFSMVSEVMAHAWTGTLRRTSTRLRAVTVTSSEPCMA
jgi:hypothetical protein